MAKLTVEQRIERAHVFLMGHPEFCMFSGVFLLGETSVKDDVPTAYTDGWNVVYGRAFMEALDDPQFRSIVVHENLHKALRQLTRWRGLFKQDPKAANHATDYVINLMIKDMDGGRGEVVLPEKVLLDERFRGMDTYEVFQILVKEKEEGGGNRRGEGDGEALDDHGWDEAPDGDDKADDGEVGSDGETLTKAEQTDNALRQGAIIASRNKSKHARGLIALTEPKVNWREVLREFVTTSASGRDMSTWRRPNRRWVHRGIYMPSVMSEAVGSVVLAVDTSGSISGKALSEFMSEVKGVCDTVKPETVELLYWGTEVVGHETYQRHEVEKLVDSTKPIGGGGTDVTSVTRYLRDKRIKIDCVIVLTDGMVFDGWGTWDAPLLVVCTTDIIAPVGKTVRI